MNHVYRVIWNHTKNVWQAVSEMATGHGKVSSQSRREKRIKSAETTTPVALFCRRSSALLALEPRIMFDAAGVATAADLLVDTDSQPVAVAEPVVVNEALIQALNEIEQPFAATQVQDENNLLGAIGNEPGRVEIVFVDASIEQYQTLIDSVAEGVEVVVLDGNGDGLQQIASYLQGRSDIDAIHILSHGGVGENTIGTAVLNADSLSTYSDILSQIGSSLTQQGDILLYGCRVGAAEGQLFVDELARVTGADVAASEDLTGSAALGGDWLLEYQTGSIESVNTLDTQALASFEGTLADPVITLPAAPTINEDASYAFSGFSATYDGSESNFEAQVTVTNAESGNIVDGGYSGPTVLSQGSLDAVNTFLNGLSFEDAADFNGTANLSITINVYSGSYAGTPVSSTSQAFDITIASVNDAPTGADNSITMDEDISHTFTAAEFGFTDANDAPADSFFAVIITSLPLNGSLTNDGLAVTLGQSVSVEDIDNNKLIFAPAANANGSGYGNFTFQVKDDGGLGNSGVDTDPSAQVMSINVTALNDAPTTVDAAIAVDKNASQTFSLVAEDNDGAADITLYQIVNIDVLNGTLTKNGGGILAAGDTLTLAEATDMTYTPSENYSEAASFTFRAIDAAGGVGGTSNDSSVEITINPVNIAPVLVVPGAQAVTEDASLVLSGITLADQDAGSADVQLTLSADNGNIMFNSISGLSIFAGNNNSHSVTVQGTLANINAALGSANLSYTPDADYPDGDDAADDTITLLVDDLGNTGGAAKTDSEVIIVTVNPTPDAPVTSVASLPAVNEDTVDPAGATVASIMSGKFTDADANTLAGIAISANPDNSGKGEWQYSVDNGASWQVVGAVTSSAALLLDVDALLRFVPEADWNGIPESLTIHAIDNSGNNGDNVSRTYSRNGSPQTTDVASGTTDIDASGVALSTSITAVDDASVMVTDVQTVLEDNNASGNVLTNDSDIDNTLTVISFQVAGDGATYSVGDTATIDAKGSLLLEANGNYTFTPVADWSGSVPLVTYTLNTGSTSTLAIGVSSVNDVPLLYVPGDTPPSAALLVANVPLIGGSLTFSSAQITVLDPDNTDKQLVFKLESLPTNGELTLNGFDVAVGTVFNYANLGQLVYTHDNSQTVADSFSVSLRDGAGGVVAATVVNLTIGTENRAPTSIGNLTFSIYEDPLTSSGGNEGWAISEHPDYEFSDPDRGARVGGIAIVSNPLNGAQGVWQYSTGDAVWSDIGSVNDTGSALLVSASTLVRFVPVADYNGTPTPLTIRVLDNTYSGDLSTSNAGGETRTFVDTAARGGSTAVSDSTNTLGVNVIAVDDDPTLVNNGGTLDADSAANLSLGASDSPTLVITDSMLRIDDIDSPDSDLTYTLVSQPADGYMARYQGGEWTQLLNGANFTQADISAESVRYILTSDPTTVSSDSFTFTVTDGDTRVKPTERPGGIYADESSPLTSLTFTVTIDNDDSTPLSVPDSSYSPPTTAGGANAAPTATAGTLTLSEGDASVVITSTVLSATDSDTLAAELTYSLVSLPTSGILRLNGSALTTNSTFTQDDVDNSRVTFSHYGKEDFTDQFDFFVTDGNNVTSVKTALIDVAPVNDQPIIDAVNSVKILEGGAIVLQGGTLQGDVNRLPEAAVVGSRDYDGGGDKSVGLAAVNILTYTVSVLPAHGEVRLEKDGQTYAADTPSTYDVMAVDSVITATKLNAGKLYYVNDGEEYTADSMTFTVNDNSGAANNTASVVLAISIIPVNDDPLVAVNTGFVGGGSLYEGQTKVLTVTDLLGTDSDNADDEIQFRITGNVSYGLLFRGSEQLGVGSAFTVAQLRAGDISYQHDGLESSGDQFDFALSDGGGGNEPAGTFSIDILPVNDTPTINLPEARTAAEQQALPISGISIADPDSVGTDLAVNNAFGPLSVTLTASNGTLNLTASGGATITNNGTASVTVSDTLGDLNATLASLIYNGNTNFVGADSIQVLVNDGGISGADPDSAEVIAAIPGSSGDGSDATNETASATLSITVQAVNDAPVNTLPDPQALDEDTSLTFSSGNSNAITVTDAVDTDAGGTDLLSTTVSVAFGTLLSVTGGGASITSNATASVTISGTAAQVNAALNGLIYTPDANYNGTDTLSVLTSDLGNSGIGGTLTDTDAIAITVNAVNDAPVATGTTLAAVDEDSVDPAGVTVATLFGDNYSDVTDTISGGSGATALAGIAIIANGEDGSNGHWQYSAGSGWVDIPTDGSLSDTAALVLSNTDLIRFKPDVADYNGIPASLTVRQSDGTAFTSGNSLNISAGIGGSGGWSNAVTLQTSVTAINDAPVLTITTPSFSATENITADLSAAGFGLVDVEAARDEGSGADQGNVQVTLTNDAGVMQVSAFGSAVITGNNSGNVIISGSLTDVNGALDTLKYTPGDNPDTTETITVVLSDLGNNGTGTTTAKTVSSDITVTVTQANDAPTATGSATLAAVNEDAGGVATIPNSASYVSPTGATVSSLFSDNFSDPDTKGSNFTLAGIGIVANAEDGSNGHWEYFTDGGSTWEAIPTAGLSNSSALVLAAADLIRFNPDAANYNGTPNSLTVHLSDGFGFVAGSAKDISAAIIDDASGWSSATVTLGTTVNAVNDAPLISNLDGDSIAFVEAVGVNVAGTAVFIDNATAASLGDIELTLRAETSFNGATLTVQQQGGADATDFFVIQVGVNDVSISGGFTEPSGLKVFNNGSSVKHLNMGVATLTNNSVDGTLQLTFNANATQDAVDAILHNLAYSNDNDLLVAGTKVVDIVFNDGNEQSSNQQGSGGALSTTATVTITLAPSNDAPILDADYTIVTTEAAAEVVKSLSEMLSLTDPDAVAGYTFAGVALAAYNDQGLGAWWVDLDGGNDNWVELSTLTPNAAAISASNALLLSASAQVKFVTTNDDVNTNGATQPGLTVYGVESAIPAGASETPVLPAFSATGALTAYDTDADTVESRVSDVSRTISVQIDARNDVPTLSATPFTSTVVESSMVGVGTSPQTLLSAVTISDPDLATTATLDSNVFGEGSITVSLDSRMAGDKFTLSGGLAVAQGVASTSGADVSSGDYVIQLTNSATLAQVTTILEAISYEHSSDNPPSGARSYSVTLNDADNLDVDADTAGGATALTVTLTGGSVEVIGVNDPATLTATASDPTYTENAVATLLFSAANVDTIQPDQTLLEFQLTISGLVDGAAEKFTIDGTEVDLVTAGAAPTTTNNGSVTVTLVGDTATLVYSHTGLTEAQSNTLINTLAYRHTSEDPVAGDRVVTLTSVKDNGGDEDTRTLAIASTVTVVPQQDKPVMSAGGTLAYTENGVAALIDATVSVDADVDDTQMASATVTIGNFVSGDILTVGNPGGLTVNYNAGTGELTLSGTASLADYTTALSSVTFNSSSEDPTADNSKNSRTLSWTVTDANSDGAGAATSDAVTSTINLTAQSDVPLVTGLGAVSYSENDPAVAIGASLILTDPDDTQLTGATVSISGDYLAGDTLNFTSQNGISIVSNASGVLTLTGTTTLANYQAALRSVTFSTASDDPTRASATRTLSWQVTDANSDAAGAASSIAVTNTLTITPLTDNPVVAVVGSQLTYNEGDVAQTVDGTLSLSDADDTHLSGATVQIGSGRLASDVLAVAGTAIGNVVGGTSITLTSYDAAAGLLTLSGSDTLANYEAVLRTVTFVNTSDDPTNNTSSASRTITFSVTDADSDGTGAGSGSDNRGVTIVPTQDAPVLSGGSQTLAYTEQAAAAVIDSTVSVSLDADDTQMSGATVVISAGYTGGDVLSFLAQNGISGSYSAGTLTLSGDATLAEYSTALQSVKFNSTSDDPTTISANRTITWQVTDANSDDAGAAVSNTVSSAITITAVNDAPTLSATPLNPSFIEANGEGIQAVSVKVFSGANASSVESGQLITGMTFTVAGLLDGVNESILVDGSTVTLESDSAATTATNGMSYTITLNGSGDTATVVLAHAGVAVVNVNSLINSISYQNTRVDYPTTGDRVFTLTQIKDDGGITDAGVNTASVAIVSTVSVAPVNDLPRITLTGGDSDMAALTETSAGLDASGTLTLDDVDLDQTVAMSILSVTKSGTTMGLVPDDAALKAMMSITGELTNVQITDALSWSFDSASESFDYLAAGEVLTLTYTLRATDSAGGTGDKTVTVTITGSNDAPTLATITTATIAEVDQSTSTTDANLSGTLVGADVDGETLSYGIDTGIKSGSTITKVGTYGTLTLDSGSGAYSYVKNDAAIEALDDGESGSDTFTLSVTDADGALVTQTLTVNVSGADDAPTLAAITTATIAEVDQSASTTDANLSGTLVGADVDDETLSYGIITGSVSGSSITKVGTYGTLTLDSGSGAYSYIRNDAAIEALDDGESGSDTFALSVTDADGALVTQTLTVNVSGADDAPTLAAITTATIAEIDQTNTTRDRNLNGTLVGEDVDVEPLTFGLDGGTDNTDGTYSKPGTYGTLTLTTATGAYRYVKNDAAIEALDDGEIGSDTFTLSVSDADGPLVTQTFTVNVSGIYDASNLIMDSNAAQVLPPNSLYSPPTLGEPSADISKNTLGIHIDSIDRLSKTLSALNRSDTDIRPAQLLLPDGEYTGVTLSAVYNPSDYLVSISESFTYTLPEGIFAHSDTSASISLEATLSDGSALPGWLSFDPDTGVFTGIPTPEYQGRVLLVVVTAKDSAGLNAQVTFRLKVRLDQDEPATQVSDKPDINDEMDLSSPDAVHGDAAEPSGEQVVRGKQGLSAQLLAARELSVLDQLSDALEAVFALNESR
ncbi:cadherin-like domain-containing protein [Neptunomonas qingdaonensis]|uniref:VCBS repeat-containing protein n=1 Tax=Neptunomonas qingdaonensis TaxID=1045558 RepID=A0A1I2S559_9GAMM|nr:cadherin-like domain-containing protein [Neptunomonas qingdaonensis]SFG48034.1 VCBS repeat-containing protein [Neptunomonas qingdaonensis]